MLLLIFLALLMIIFLMLPRLGKMGSNELAGQMTIIAVIAVIWYVAHLLGIV